MKATPEQAFQRYKYIAESSGKIPRLHDAEKMRSLVGNIITYFYEYESTLLETQGLLVTGKVGQGKTMMFNIIQKMLRLRQKPSFNMVSHLDLLETYTKEGDPGLQKYMNAKSLVIDDVIDEKSAKVFGNEWSLNDFLLKRYVKWENEGCLTHYTTNLTLESFFGMFDDRCQDRLIQMTQVVEMNFSDISYRKRNVGQMPKSNSNQSKETPQHVKDKIDMEFKRQLEDYYKPNHKKGINVVVHRSFYQIIFDRYQNTVDLGDYNEDDLIQNELTYQPRDKFGKALSEGEVNREKLLKRALGSILFDKLCSNNFNFLQS